MNVTARLLIFTILVFTLTCVKAQTTVAVSEPELSIKNNKVQIGYDLLNTARSEKFTVRIEVTNGSGELIPAESFTGDVGEHIPGGGNKKILWDIEADSVFLDEDVFFQVIALPEKPPEAEVIPLAENIQEEGQGEDETINPAEDNTRGPGDKEEPVAEGSDESVGSGEAENVVTGKEFNRTALIVQSLALPGLGLTRAKEKPHWIRGVAGYGCIAGAIILNRTAYSNYQSYLDSESTREVDELFNKAQSQKTTSQILGYAAIGIWVADLVWNIAGTSNLNEKQAGIKRGISVGAAVEPLSATPQLCLRYRF